MEVKDIDNIAKELGEIYDEMKPLKEKLEELENRASILEAKLSEALVSSDKDSWEISGRKPFKLSVSTYWNVADIQKFMNNIKPEMLSIGYLGQAIRAWANAELKDGKDPSEQLGLRKYEKVRIIGGGKIK